MLLQLLQHLLNGFHTLFAFGFGIDEDVIEVYYHENVKLLCQDLVDITLEGSWYIGQSKRHHLILKMAIAGPKDCLLFVAFFDLYPMVDIGQIKLDEISSPT